MTDLTATVGWDELDHVWDDVIDDDTRAIYSAYRRLLGVGARPAIVAIDLYVKAFQGGARPPVELQGEFPSSCGAFAHDAVGAIVDVFATARDLGVPIIHMTASGAAVRGTATNRRTPAAATGEEDAGAFFPALAPVPGETVIEKERASSFAGTPLLAELVMRGIDTVIVVGESTSGCVRASVVDAYSSGFHVVVVEDGVFDRVWLTHQVNLFDLHHKYADVMDSRHATALLRQAVRTPAGASR